MIDFKLASKEEARTISAIAQRAVLMAGKAGVRYGFMEADMDITACHVNAIPLRLDELLGADEFNFAHDVFGIRRHLNRETGKLENCFAPRFAKAEKVRHSQHGLAGLLVLALISAVIGTGWAMVQPAAGTYSVVSDNGSLIRTDTRTGSMQRCHVAGTVLTCETISAQQ